MIVSIMIESQEIITREDDVPVRVRNYVWYLTNDCTTSKKYLQKNIKCNQTF